MSGVPGLDLVATKVLCAVQGLVSQRHQFRRMLPVLGERGDAEADGQAPSRKQFLAFAAPPFDRAAQTLGECDRLALVGLGQDEGELFPAIARSEVVLPGGCLEDLGERAQQ